MKKKIIISTTLLLIATALWISYRIIYIPAQTVPFPYIFATNTQTPEIELLNSSRDAEILIIGDRMAKNLFAFREVLSSTISTDLARPINIGLLADQFDGLHRTIDKLERLKKLPKIIIYHGASNEEFEYKFATSDIDKINSNFNRYHNPYLQTLLMTSNKFAKFIYNRVLRIKLSPIIEKNCELLPHPDRQTRSEITYKLFNAELKQMIDLIKKRRSLLIILTTPINLDIAPKEVCNDSINDEINVKLSKAKTLIEHGDFKSSSNLLEEAKDITPGNATLYYLLGQAQRGMGRDDLARNYLDIASGLDCKRWRSNSVFNSIIRTTARENESLFFDFDMMVRSSWNDGLTFVDDIYPQDIYYQKAIKALGGQLKTLLKL